MSKKINARQSVNREILEVLSQYVEKYPDLRFGQILLNSGLVQKESTGKNWVGGFYEEPWDALARMIKEE